MKRGGKPTVVMNERLFQAMSGGIIRSLREGAGLTQESIAKAVGISRTSVVNIEQGRQNISLFVATKLAGALGCGVDRLLPPKSGWWTS